MRQLSQAIKDVLNADYGETKDVVIITIPEQVTPPIAETVLYLANGEDITIDSQLYSNKLRNISNIKFTMGHAPDTATIVVQNVDKELGVILTDTDRFLDGAKAEIKRAFKIADGTFETDTLFVGQVKDIKVTQEAVEISIVSDMSKRGTSVAGRTLTQRCIWVFNKNGSGVGPQCGWVTTQPGDPLACDHDLDSAGGCKGHGNQHRFGGVPAFTALGAGNGYDPNSGGGWGSGSGGGWCIHPDSWVLCINSQNLKHWIQAFAVTEHDWVVTMDKFGKTKKTRVNNVIKGTTTQIISINTSKGFSLKCSPTHPIITHFNDDVGTPAQNLKVNDRVIVGTLDEGKFMADIISSIEVLEMSCNVMIFELSQPYHIFVAGETKKGGILSHNTKPIFTNQGGGYPIEWYT